MLLGVNSTWEHKAHLLDVNMLHGENISSDLIPQ